MELYDFIWFLVVGGLAGWIASILVEGSGFGLLGDIVIGVIGAFLGGFVAYKYDITVYGFAGTLGMAILGSIVFLVILRALTRRRKAV